VTRTFIVATDTLRKEQRDHLTQYLQRERWGFWHWLPDFWIVQPVNHTLTAGDIRQLLVEVFESQSTPPGLSLGSSLNFPGPPKPTFGHPSVFGLYGKALVSSKPNLLVIALQGGEDWSGFGPPEMFEWLHKNQK
jgi:hypothetical protein